MCRQEGFDTKIEKTDEQLAEAMRHYHSEYTTAQKELRSRGYIVIPQETPPGSFIIKKWKYI